MGAATPLTLFLFASYGSSKRPSVYNTAAASLTAKDIRSSELAGEPARSDCDLAWHKINNPHTPPQPPHSPPPATMKDPSMWPCVTCHPNHRSMSRYTPSHTRLDFKIGCFSTHIICTAGTQRRNPDLFWI